MAISLQHTTHTTLTPTPDQQSAVEAYVTHARDAGCPPDQIERFLTAGLVLQPQQLLASAQARSCDHPTGPTEILFGGARAGGKSWWMVAQIGADDCQRCPGLKALILRRVGRAVRESFEDLRLQVLRHLPHDYRKQDATLTFPNTSRIILGHFKDEKDIDAYLGLEYDVIGVEEATTLTSSKFSSIRTTCRTSKLLWRPRIYLTANPGGVGHTHIKTRFVIPYRNRHTLPQTDTRFIPATVDDNKFVNHEYEHTLSRLTGWQLRAWRYGDWDIAAGQFFTTFRQQAHVIPTQPIPPGHRVWGSLDYGFTHYTVFYLLEQDNDGNIIIVDEHASRQWLPQRHVPAIKALLARHKLNVSDLFAPLSPRNSIQDPVRIVAGLDVFAQRGIRDKDGAQTIAETYSALGLPLSPAYDDRVNGAAEFLSRLGDPIPHAPGAPSIPARLFIQERCPLLIDTIPNLEHDPYHPEDVLKTDTDEQGLGGDDAYDAARYGIMAAWRPPVRENKIIRPKNRQRYGFV